MTVYNKSTTVSDKAQSPSDQCPHYNKSDTDDKHSPCPTNATLQQVNNSLRH